VWSTCPPLQVTLPPATTSILNVGFGYIAGLGLALALIVFLFLVSCLTRCAKSKLGEEALKSMDLFSIKPPKAENHHPTYLPSYEGGLVTGLALSVILLYAIYMILQWTQNNIFTTNSLALLAGSLAEYDALPWAKTSVLPGLPPTTTALAVRITVAGDAAACAAPLDPPQSLAMERGAWVLEGSKATCGGDSGVSQHTFVCPGCLLTPGSALVLRFHYSCQAFVVEGGAVPAEPPNSPRVFRAPLQSTVASAAEGTLAQVKYTLNVALNTRQDVDGTLSKGYVVASSSTLVTRKAPSSQSASFHPNAAAVVVSINTPLADTQVVSVLQPLIPLATLIC